MKISVGKRGKYGNIVNIYCGKHLNGSNFYIKAIYSSFKKVFKHIICFLNTKTKFPEDPVFTPGYKNKNKKWT